jgi:hypothetical protein
MKEVDTVGIPWPFEFFYPAKLGDTDFVERLLHDAFDDRRVRNRREFFRIDPERVRFALELAAVEQVTPRTDVVETAEDKAALEKERT